MTAALNRPLDGVRVLDLTHTLAGPLCTRVLADLGAEVVKVEAPGGDQVRPYPPVIVGASAFFHHFNVGKRSVCIDIRTPAGAELVARLAEQADVLVENWRPGALGRRGLGPADLLARNPRLVYCSITGWGQTGPWAQHRAYAPLVHAEVGTIEAAARLRGTAAQPEVLQLADVHGGMAAVTAVLSALLLRARTGAGQHLDCTLSEAHLYVNDQVANDLVGYTGMRSMDTWTFPIVTLADGDVACLVTNPVRNFLTWVRILGGEALDDDPRFATVGSRDAHRPEMLRILDGLSALVPSYADLEERCADHPVFVCRVRSAAELARSDWAAERRVFTEPGVPVAVPTALFRATVTDASLTGPAPGLGEHNAEVLERWLGLDADTVVALEAAGTLASPAT